MMTGSLRIDAPEKYVAEAADDIDSRLGYVYVTPLTFVVTDPKQRAASLVIKKINNNLATGRAIMAASIPAEDKQLNAYGAALVDEAEKTLDLLADRTIPLFGAVAHADTGPVTEVIPAISIHNEDATSLVNGFYKSMAQPTYYPTGIPAGGM
jgi:hypothetical protein